MHEAKFRALKFGVTRVKVRNASNGVQYVEADQPLPAFPERLIDKLPFWAGATPNKTFMARRAKLTTAERGEWEHLTYHTAWQRAQSIAQGYSIGACHCKSRWPSSVRTVWTTRNWHWVVWWQVCRLYRCRRLTR